MAIKMPTENLFNVVICVLENVRSQILFCANKGQTSAPEPWRLLILIHCYIQVMKVKQTPAEAKAVGKFYFSLQPIRDDLTTTAVLMFL